MKISVSLLSTYLYCPRKLFLQNVLKLEEPPKDVVVLGSIRHKAIEMANNTEEQIVTSITKNIDFEEISRLYHEKYQDILETTISAYRNPLQSVGLTTENALSLLLPKMIDEAKIRASNVLNFILDNDVYGKELWQKLTPKIKSEVRLESDSLQLKGIIDQIHVYQNGAVPVELKTGKIPREGVWPGHRIQIAAYALLLEEHLHHPIKEGFVRYLDAKEQRHIAINPMMKDEIKKLVADISSLINSFELPQYCDNKNKCTSCSFRLTCYDNNKMAELMNAKLKEGRQLKLA